MGSAVVVPAQVAAERACAVLACAPDVGVRPFAQQDADECFGLAVGLGAAWAGAAVLERVLVDGGGEAVRAIPAAVIGQEAFDGDAVRGEEGKVRAQRSRARL